MMDDKELLICLVIGFSNSLKLLDHEPDDGNDDNLNRMGSVMEKLSAKIFDEKINMDFGMIHALADHSEQIIEYIENYET